MAMKTIGRFASRCKGRMWLSVLFALISVIGGFVPYYAVYRIIHLYMSEAALMDEVLFWIGVSIGGYTVKILFHSISTLFSHVAAYTILESIRLSVADKLMKVPLGVVLSDTVGRLKNIIIDKIDSIELSLAHMIPEGISNLILPVVVFIYMAVIEWRMALAAAIVLPLAFVGFLFMMRGFSKEYDNYMKSSDYVNSVIVEYVEGIEVIKAFNQSTSSYRKFVDAVETFKESTLRWFQNTWFSKNFCMSVLPSTLLGMLPMGTYLYSVGEITLDRLTICLILSLGIVAPLVSLANLLSDVKAIVYAVNDINELLATPELIDGKDHVLPDHYQVVLNEVSFSYTEDKANKVLDGISLVIPEGSFTALVGASGSGKSTIARLIARFWDVDVGSIMIGDKDIRNIPIAQISDLISFVTQDNFLFNCSLMENIRLGNPKASDEKVFQAAKAARCDEFITALEHGYHTMAGEVGDKLSGGERQRIAIARAILKDAPIVILDEATAFTDPENEALLQKSISKLTKGKTLIVIAHRLSTIKNADQIAVIEAGKVLAKGTQDSLLKECKTYQDMWEAHIGSRDWAAIAEPVKEELR